MKFKGSVQKKSSKKRPATKAKQYKVSLGKLENKKNNRLAKQGKLRPRKKKGERKDWVPSQQRHGEKQAQSDTDNSENETSAKEEAEVIDPEDTSYFSHLSYARDFAQADLSLDKDEGPEVKKRKIDDGEAEEGIEEYEQGARTFAEEENKSGMKMMLPIIANGKVIRRMATNDEAEDKQVEDNNDGGVDANGVESGADEIKPLSQKQKELAYMKTLSSAQIFAYRESKLREKKAMISALSHLIMEDPQNNMNKLKELRLMLGETDLGVSLTVRKYAMVSMMEVFKDIVPGYRLRIPTEKESSSRLKKETRSLLDYEASFLLNYRIYLEFLETMAKVHSIPENSFLAKHGICDLKIPKSSAVPLGALAVKCLCEMLVNHPHFNYRDNLINMIVPFSNHGRPAYNNKTNYSFTGLGRCITYFSEVTCETIKKVFETDKRGDATLEIVKAIGRMAKRKQYDVRPQVLLTFLSLKIKEVDFSSVAKAPKKMARAERMKLYSRRERKQMKLKEKVDKELLETKATEDRAQILKLHTLIIQSVFETFIRVIKLASDSISLGPVLEGLAQFAHLINVEYFDSLFRAFRRLIQSGKLTTRETLHCLQTVFTILSGQGSVLNIDPTKFYQHLYAALLSVHLGIGNDTTPIILKSLDIMISKRRKHVSQQRILAFMKRLSSLCLQQTPDTVMAYMAVVRRFLHTYKHTDVLLDTDVQGSGVYMPLLEDPEHCCANSTSLWELHLLMNHYEPDVRKYSEHILKGAPISGPYQLSTDLSRRAPEELYKKYHSKEIFPASTQEKCINKKKSKRSGFLDSDFEAYTQKVLESVDSCDEDEEEEEEDNAMDVG